MIKLFATTIIRNAEGKFLTLHARHAKEHEWRFPGGKLDLGETPIQCAIRELYEEIDIAPLTEPKYLGYKFIEVEGQTWLGYVFQVDRYAGEPRNMEPGKHDEMRWLTAAELQALGSEFEYSFVKDLHEKCLSV
jgi:8-oxo-dGTP diphosphatase